MTLAHFFLPPEAWDEDCLRLTGDEAKHCAQVTRHKAGDHVVAFDGAGRRAECRIALLGKTEVSLTRLTEQLVPKPARPITLLQAVTKGDTFEWILEKAVELGVQHILPVITERTIVRLDARDAVKKHEKWQRLVLEACKQCGQAWLPQLHAPCSLEQGLALAQPVAVKLVASLQHDALLRRSLFPSQPTCAAVAIGPEGDFSPHEHEQLARSGWQPWSLGSLVLRSETAAVCALSILSYELHSVNTPLNAP